MMSPGKDALNLCDRIVTRDMKKCAVGQAVYSAWCDEEGKTLQDGTIFRVSENHSVLILLIQCSAG